MQYMRQGGYIMESSQEMIFAYAGFDVEDHLVVFTFTYEQDTLFMEVEVL